MKAKKIELDVDFIGGQGPLTAEEEKALSDFFKKRKMDTKRAADNKKVKTAKSTFRQSPGQ
jgi:hypothetical protein